jgi:hypothetical protein
MNEYTMDENFNPYLRGNICKNGCHVVCNKCCKVSSNTRVYDISIMENGMLICHNCLLNTIPSVPSRSLYCTDMKTQTINDVKRQLRIVHEYKEKNINIYISESGENINRIDIIDGCKIPINIIQT